MTTSSTAITVPDIERAALTILAQANPVHPALRAWRDRLVEDAADAQYPDAALLAAIAARRADDAAYEPDGDPLGNQQRAEDAAVLHLGNAVVRFRRDGRPTGDVTRAQHGMGGPLATVTTSLAAAVAEYVGRLRSAYAQRVLDERSA